MSLEAHEGIRVQLADWLQAGESVALEFKKSTAEKERACRTLCAFANRQGGVLLFGVTPAGRAQGQTVSDRTLEELAQEFLHFEPPIFPSLERVSVDGGRDVLVVRVSRSERLISYRGVAYDRLLNTTQVMSRDRQHQLITEELHAVQRWENQPAEGWDITRLDAREMVLTLEEAIRRGRIEDPGSREPQEILRGLGLLRDGNTLSRAAVVLFCKDDVPLPDFPQLLLKVARFKGTTRDEFLDNRQFHGNAFLLMRRAERFLIESLPIAGRILPDRMEREDIPLFPVEALREALANAFVHRDYSIGGGSVGVALYDDRLEIISIGDLHFGLTPESLQHEHESKPWNPMVAAAFYRRGIIEAWGRGTLKIARLMREAGLEPPVMTVRAGAVVLTFDVEAAMLARGMRLPRVREPDALSEDRERGASLTGADLTQARKTQVTPQVETLLSHLDAEMSRTELQGAVDITDRKYFRRFYLWPAINNGLIEMTQPDKPQSRSQRYRLTEAGRELRRLLAARQRP
ncbi:MAG: ATP-binding protein [Lautropia sp.]|nr:ATP-binding protein [Lautropia sp.]